MPDRRQSTDSLQDDLQTQLRDNCNQVTSNGGDNGAIDLYEMSEACRQVLNDKQQSLWGEMMERYGEWLVKRGKDPEKKDGLKKSTAENYLKRVDQIHRQIWALTGNIVLHLTHGHANQWCNALNDDEITKRNGDPYGVASKRKQNDALRKYFSWRAAQRGDDPWDPPAKFSDSAGRQADELSRDERRALREAALKYDTIRSYSDCSPEQRTRLKSYIAQRLGKPKKEVTPSDWEQINTSWLYPALTWVALDAGLRPVEVHRADVDWVRLEKQTLAIPKEQSAKTRDNWEVALRSGTSQILEHWIEERGHLEKYDESDALWLTREGNRWTSSSLNPLLRNLCEAADIDQTNRRVNWYSIRHSVGELMTKEGSLAEAKEQLRHKSLESTLKYTSPSPEDRRTTLDKMG